LSNGEAVNVSATRQRRRMMVLDMKIKKIIRIINI
jgi:hypothetical protein